jgi:hypothetical protein
MDKNQKILDEVKKTISLLDNVKNIEPNPFLFTRIKAQIDSKKYEAERTADSVVLRFVKQSVFILLILFNIYTIVNYLNTDKQTSESREQHLKNIKSEYSLVTETDYLANIEIKD